VLWRSDEAYLFMYDRPIGYVKHIELSDGAVSGIFLCPGIAGRRHMESFDYSNNPRWPRAPRPGICCCYRTFTPIDGGIYADCPGGLCQWTGARFQLLSDQEQQKMGGEKRLSKVEFAQAEGWSRRAINGGSVGEKPDRYDFSIDTGHQVRIVVRGNNPVSVDVQRLNQAPKRVWYHEQRTYRVSTAEYEQAFRQH
jgi:hypothetical protein